MTRLCLGTAQFGMSYGVKNVNGQLDIGEVERILGIFEKTGNNLIDTAISYGDSEEILGNAKKDSNFNIITKIPSLQNLGKVKYSYLDTVLAGSCARLKAEKLETVLLHDSTDLCGENAGVVRDWFKEIKAAAKVKKVGVSIYDREDLQEICLDSIDVVQLPLSIYNQELMQDGTIQELKEHNIEIHSRSVFLQGILLSSEEELPVWISKKFRLHHQKWVDMVIENGKSQIETSLGFIKHVSGIDAIVVGVDSCHQLKELLDVWKKCESVQPCLVSPEWNWPDKKDIDPRFWAK